MSIAELIMQGTKRTSDSNAGVGDSLIKLGQQVGAALAEREQNKQAQEILPFLQQSMQESMKLAQDGDTAGAYSNMMGIFAANPDLMRNKAALPFFELGLKGINESANTYQQTQNYDQRQSYYDKVTANKTSGDESTFVDTSGYGFGSVDNNTVTPLPVNMNQPVDEIPQNEGFTGNFSAGINDEIQEETPAQQAGFAGKQNVENVISLPTDQQAKATEQFAITDYNSDQYEVRNIAGLSKYLPNFVGFAVPKESWKETAASLSGKGELSRQSKMTAPQARENFLKDNGTEFAVKQAVATMGDKTMTSLFNDYGKDIYALRASTDQRDDPRSQEPIYTVTGKDGKDKKITKDQYAAIETIAGITPAVAENAGGTPAIFKTVKDRFPKRKNEEKTSEGVSSPAKETTATPPPPPDQQTPFDEAETQKQTEKQTQSAAAAKKSLENKKTKIENSISELQDKIKILTAVAQDDNTILPEYLKPRMRSYQTATPARNKQDYLVTQKQIKELTAELNSLRKKILESSK